MYKKKGDKVINMNLDAMNVAKDKLIKIAVPEHWAELEEKSIVEDRGNEIVPESVSRFMDPLKSLEGDKMPVS